MPLYEYRCRCCGERFERLVRAPGDGRSLEAQVVCPRCQATEVERLFSAFARAASACAPAPGGGG